MKAVKPLKRKEGGEEQGGRINSERVAADAGTLQEFTMESVTAFRSLDLLIALSLLSPFIHANRMITDTPDIQKSHTIGKHIYNLCTSQVATRDGTLNLYS